MAAAGPPLRRCALLLVLAALAGGCGGDDPEGPDTTPAQAFSGAFSQSWCELATDCGLAQVYGDTLADCTSWWRIYLLEVTDPDRCTYDAVSAHHCLDQLEESTCADLQGNELPDACNWICTEGNHL